MSRTYNTIRYNALTRKALAHGYRDAEEYLRHTPRLRHRLHECPVGRTCPRCSDNRRHSNAVRLSAARQRQRESGGRNEPVWLDPQSATFEQDVRELGGRIIRLQQPDDRLHVSDDVVPHAA